MKDRSWKYLACNHDGQASYLAAFYPLEEWCLKHVKPYMDMNDCKACSKKELLGNKTTLDCFCKIYPEDPRCEGIDSDDDCYYPEVDPETFDTKMVPCKEGSLRRDRISALLKTSKINIYAGSRRSKYPQEFRVWIMRIFNGERQDLISPTINNAPNPDYIPELKALSDSFSSSYYGKDGFSSLSPKVKMIKTNGFIRDRVDGDVLDKILWHWENPNGVDDNSDSEGYGAEESKEGDGVVDLDPGEVRDLAKAIENSQLSGRQMDLFQ